MCGRVSVCIVIACVIGVDLQSNWIKWNAKVCLFHVCTSE